MSVRSTTRRLVALGGSAAALALLLPVLAAAAQGPEAPSTAEWVYRWLNFALVFGVGGWFAGRKLKVAFRRNAEKIATTIAEAEEAKRQAAERLQAAEAKLAAVDHEAEEMRERARREGGVLGAVPGKVVRILVEAGQEVERDQGLLVIEAMKMQTTLYAHADGVVGELNAAVGDSVETNDLLVKMRGT